MITTGNEHGVDARGQPVLWSSQRQQVMMHWEKQYMHACVDALHIQASDRVLEIGFGLAYSATHIQHYHPHHHTIVECDAAVIHDAEQFASTHSGVEVLHGTWQSMLPTLREHFDCVFFDDYPLPELERAGVTHNQTRSLRSRSRWHDFLDAVLPLVAVGGRVTGYLARDIDLQRRGCRVEISQLRVSASDDCAYFPHDSALVPVITVLDVSAAAADGDSGASNSESADSEAALRVPLFPTRVSLSLLQRVAAHSSSHECALAATAGARPRNAPQSASSQWRRFADIRECLKEQALMELTAPESEHDSVADGDDDTSSAYSASPTASTASNQRYRDAASRAQFLAALREKRASTHTFASDHTITDK